METSSPLAAMRPPVVPFHQVGMYRSHPHAHLAVNPIGSGTLNLRDQFLMQRSKHDYFNVKPVQGSSPTASLAADMSQNFCIDNEVSPTNMTPRRQLFGTSTIMGALDGRDFITTPPIPPSSSPVPTCDMMDLSPLPHKAPFVAQIEIHSPTPVSTPADDLMMMETDSLIPQAAYLEPPKPIIPERRKTATLRRPSLTRTKGYSTGGIPSRLHTDNPLQTFRFGGESRFSSGLSMSPSECFADSPPQERRPQTANSPSAAAAAAAAAKPKPHFGSLGGAAASRHGSPFNEHARRPSNPFARPRKMYRRSLSMFENPGDVVKPKESSMGSTLQAVIDVEEPHKPVLPHFFPDGQNDSIPRIAHCTMLDVLDGRYNGHYDQKMVIDCRFEYEYEGGHIDSAVNYNDKELLARHLFRTPMEGRTLLIFHCEYSAHRAPIMARHIRSEDRTANAEFYPKLTYPEVYILDGGYSGFFADHRDRCYPQAYVEMDAAQHANTCEREMDRLRQNRRGLSRAQTFAFGQRNAGIEDSPTAPGRNTVRDSPSMMIGASPILGNDRCHARRMASY